MNKDWSSSEFKKNRNKNRCNNFQSGLHKCSGYWRPLKTLPVFPITPCKYFSSSPQSWAKGNRSSYATWQAERHLLPNHSSVALTRDDFFSILYHMVSVPKSSDSLCHFFFHHASQQVATSNYLIRKGTAVDENKSISGLLTARQEEREMSQPWNSPATNFMYSFIC